MRVTGSSHYSLTQEGDFFDLIHFDVTDLVSGETGKVVDVVDYSGNVVLTLDILGKEILLPLSETYLSAVDWENASLQVNIPKELAELKYLPMTLWFNYVS